jgi:hypothetical protein
MKPRDSNQPTQKIQVFNTISFLVAGFLYLVGHLAG